MSQGKCDLATKVASIDPPAGSLVKKAAVLSKSLASLKFPPITSIAHSMTRSKDWDDVLTAHTDEPLVRSWTVLNKRLGKHTWSYADGAKRKHATGSVKVWNTSYLTVTTYKACVVRLRFCMWELRYCGLVDGGDSHVEHAVWLEAENI